MAENQNPRGPIAPSYEPCLRSPTYNASHTLIDSLGSVVDIARQIAVDLGARPYTVHAVRVRWDGGELGRGDPVVVSDIPLQPTPKKVDGGLPRRDTESAGTLERGPLVLTGVSPRYTEDELTSYFDTGDGAHEAFYEVRIDERDGPENKRRRYVLSKAPERRPTICDWRLTLERQEGDRQRNGSRRPEREKIYGAI